MGAIVSGLHYEESLACMRCHLEIGSQTKLFIFFRVKPMTIASDEEGHSDINSQQGGAWNTMEPNLEHSRASSPCSARHHPADCLYKTATIIAALLVLFTAAI